MAEQRQNSMPDPGKIRGLQKVTSADGFFITCAIDHGDDYRELIDPDLAKVPYERTAESKIKLIENLSGTVSSFLLDPEYSAAQSIFSGALPGHIGLMVCIEEEGGYAGTGPKGETRYRKNWTAAKIKRMGADMCKVLWFFRPDSAIAETQKDILKGLVKECADASIPLVVEPIWNPLEGEDASSFEWKTRRAEGIVESAIIAAELGADVLKMEFPGSVENESEISASAARCRRITDSVDVPWVILSAGVGYESFRQQVRTASENGASGFMAGRSIWRDAVRDTANGDGTPGIGVAISRLSELGQITRDYGRPFKPVMDVASITASLEKYWYTTWS